MPYIFIHPGNAVLFPEPEHHTDTLFPMHDWQATGGLPSKTIPLKKTGSCNLWHVDKPVQDIRHFTVERTCRAKPIDIGIFSDLSNKNGSFRLPF